MHLSITILIEHSAHDQMVSIQHMIRWFRYVLVQIDDSLDLPGACDCRYQNQVLCNRTGVIYTEDLSCATIGGGIAGTGRAACVSLDI